MYIEYKHGMRPFTIKTYNVYLPSANITHHVKVLFFLSFAAPKVCLQILNVFVRSERWTVVFVTVCFELPRPAIPRAGTSAPLLLNVMVQRKFVPIFVFLLNY
jgi:hypothetical protein